MSRLKRGFRRLRTLLWTATALVIIGAAVIVGVGKLLMPYSERFKPRLEAVLAEHFNQPVRVDAFTGEWKAFGPRISLEGVNLLGDVSGEDALAIERAAVDIKPLNALISGRPLYSFRIIGADLALVRFADGRFELSGLGLSGRRVGETGQDSGLGNLARIGELRLQDSRFSYSDEMRDVRMQLVGIDGRLQARGDQLGLEVRASLSDPGRERILGDLAATVLARLGEDQPVESLEFHVETGEIMMQELADHLPEHELKPASGRLNAQLWGSWSPGEPQEMAGVVDIRDASIDTGGERLVLDHLNTRLDWRWRDKTQWRIDLADVRIQESGRSWTAPRIAVERNLEGNLGVWVSADALQAEFPLAVTQLFMQQLGRRWPKAAPTAGRGPVRDFDLVINRDRELVATSGSFEDLEVLAWGPWPLTRGLSGRIDLAFGEGSLYFGGEDVEIRWDRNFTRPLVADFQDCELEILWTGREFWQVDALPCGVSSEVIEGEARVRVVKDEGKPRVDVNAHIRSGDLAGLRPYWPRSIMSPEVTGWLERSVEAGRITDARFLMQGDMDRFPFPDGAGLVLAEATVQEAKLDYADGWPAAEQVDAQLRIAGTSLAVSGRIGDLAGAEVQEARAGLANLRRPVLELDYRSEAGLQGLAAFLEASPLLENSQLEPDRFRFQGEAVTTGSLRVPLGDAPGEFTVAGTVDVTGARFTDQASSLRLEGLTGRVSYDREGARGTGLETTLGGWPARLGFEAAWGTERPFAATLDGRFPASLIIAQTPVADDPLLRGVGGESDWRLELDVRRPEPAAPVEVWLGAESDLTDVILDLPAPLSKSAGAPRPLSLKYPLVASEALMEARLGEDVALALELGAGATSAGTELLRGAVALGGAEPVLPEKGRFSLGGVVDRLDLDRWVDVIVDYGAADRYPSQLGFEGATLQAGELVLLNRSFEDIGLALGLEDEVLDVSFRGEAIDGDVRYARNDDGTHVLSAQLERLLLPEPIDSGMSMESDPRALPEIHLLVDELQFMGLDLGETRIEAFPIADGLRIESVDAASSQLTFQARGDWVVDETGGNRSDFDIVLTSESLGAIVNALDLSSVLVGGQTIIRYDAWWPGPPAAFELARLNGQMNFSVIDGRILNADPGAGRMLGLISVGALPRRLALDFSDVFESGFGFDQANGTIRLDSGTAYTDDFVLESTAAQLTISGSSDLEAKEFDYLMSIRPGVSQALPVLGAIAAGPAGAAAGLALQGLLRDALGDAAEARYEITGPWSDPAVERLPSTPGSGTQPSTAQAQTTEGK